MDLSNDIAGKLILIHLWNSICYSVTELHKKQNHFDLVRNEMNLKKEIRLTKLNGILFFKSYKLLFELSSFKQLYMCRFGGTLLTLAVIRFICWAILKWCRNADILSLLMLQIGRTLCVRFTSKWNMFTIRFAICESLHLSPANCYSDRVYNLLCICWHIDFVYFIYKYKFSQQYATNLNPSLKLAISSYLLSI